MDINRLMVARYPAMDWNGDGYLQDDGTERGYTDPWYKAIVTCWVDDWYYKYDRDYDGDNQIGGQEKVLGQFAAFKELADGQIEEAGSSLSYTIDEDLYLYGYQEGVPCTAESNGYCDQYGTNHNNGYNVTTIGYLDSADDFDDLNNDGYWNPPEPFYEISDQLQALHPNASTSRSDYQYIDCSQETSNCGGSQIGAPTDGYWIYYNTFDTQGAIVMADFEDCNTSTETIGSVEYSPGSLCESDSNWQNSYGNQEWDANELLVGVYYDNGIREADEAFIDWDGGGSEDYDTGEPWNEDSNGNSTFDTGYSATNDEGTKEVGSANDYTFADELKELIANFGLEYWYTDSFVLRAGYIYDKDGKIMNPTFGAGIRFGQYGFDFGYTAGAQDHARANTMFFSISMEL